jgi:hypothetical protein
VKIPSTLQPLLDVVSRDLPRLLQQLQIGQILQARVTEQPRPGLLRLQIASIELLARSQVSLQPGTEIKLEVVKGPPLPELRVLSEPPPRELREQIVRSAMVRQMPPQELREAVDLLRTQPMTAKFAARVHQFSALLRDTGVRIDQLQPAPLREAVMQSGLFHEARLLAGIDPQTTDIKMRLLQLAAVLRADLGPKTQPRQPGAQPAPNAGEPTSQAPSGRELLGDALLTRLIRLVEGSVSRIQLQQSAALPVEDSPRQVWQLDLPIHLPGGSDDLMLRIERDASGDSSDRNPGWSVNLSFDFDTIGSVQCRVALAGDQVTTTFRVDRASTLQRLQAQLPTLEDALKAQGLDVVHLEGVLGGPAEQPMRIPLPDRLLDERA